MRERLQRQNSARNGRARDRGQKTRCGGPDSRIDSVTKARLFQEARAAEGSLQTDRLCRSSLLRRRPRSHVPGSEIRDLTTLRLSKAACWRISILLPWQSNRRSRLNQSAEELSLRNRDMLSALGAIGTDTKGKTRITWAGLLLFGKTTALRRLAPSARIDYVLVDGADWVPERQPCHCGVIEIYGSLSCWRFQGIVRSISARPTDDVSAQGSLTSPQGDSRSPGARCSRGRRKLCYAPHVPVRKSRFRSSSSRTGWKLRIQDTPSSPPTASANLVRRHATRELRPSCTIAVTETKGTRDPRDA